MEFRRLAVFMALFVLAVSQYSDAHSMHRRQAYEDVYDDSVLADEANDEDPQNDTDLGESPKPTLPPAEILTAPSNYEANTGSAVRLPCNVAPDNTVVQWYKNNELYFLGNFNLHPLETRFSIADKSKDLIIRNVQPSDTGVYKCETVHKVPAAVNHTLLVFEKPMVYNMSASQDGVVSEGSELTLNCHVTGSPEPTVLWSLTRPDRPNERLAEKDGEFSVNGNLFSFFIKEVKKEHAGQYYCYAFNKIGTHQAEITVTVNPKPRVHVTKTIVNSDLRTEALLQCAAHEETRSHIRWYKDGKLIEDSEPNYVISTRGAHSNLTVAPAADEDFGTFTCEAENDYGKHNRSIELVQSPVVEELEVDGPKMSWVVQSHQKLLEMEIQLRPLSEDGEWKQIEVPIPQENNHMYETTFLLEDKGLEAGDYQAVVKAKNTKSWGGSNEPVLVKIEVPQPQYIQHASVFRDNAGDSIRPTFTLFSTVLMYLLVRML